MDKLMEILTSEYALNFWIPVIFLIVGAFTLIKPPAFRSNRGVATKRAMKAEDVWKYVHKVVGLLCIVFAVVLAITAYLTATIIGGTAGYLVQIAIEIAAIALLVPITNWLTDRKFDWNR